MARNGQIQWESFDLEEWWSGGVWSKKSPRGGYHRSDGACRRCIIGKDARTIELGGNRVIGLVLLVGNWVGNGLLRSRLAIRQASFVVAIASFLVVLALIGGSQR